MDTHYVNISFFGDAGVGKTSVSDRFFKMSFQIDIFLALQLTLILD